MILIPKQAKYEQQVNSLNNEIVRLKSEMDNKKVYADCDTEAKDKSKELLGKKIELAKNSGDPRLPEYQKAYDLGLNLKDDYNYLYDNCLRRQGVKY